MTSLTLPARWCALLALLAGVGACRRGSSDHGRGTEPASASAPAPAPATEMPLVQPNELAKLLATAADKPLLFHVGFQKLYLQAHIAGSEFLGPTSDDEALARLRKRVADLPRTTSIVIYCGCCPWERCPNVKRAYQALHELGFSNTKVLFIAQDLGADWVDKGYPVATGA